MMSGPENDSDEPGSFEPELRSGPPWVMEEMIASEPRLAEQILSATQPAEDVANIVGSALERGKPVLVTGCGTSEHGALAVAAMLRAASGSRGGGWPSIQARQAFEASLDTWDGGVCLGISHEGETRATIAAMRAARSRGAATALITAAPRSSAAAEADHIIDTPLRDRSWCHTVGYLSPILAGGAVAAALRGESLDPEVVRAHLEACAEIRDSAAEVAGALHGIRHLLAAGSGVDTIASRELALKVEEGVRMTAVGRDLETVMHGHLVSCDETVGLVVLVSDPRSRSARAERAVHLLNAAARIGLRTAAVVTPDVDGAWDPSLTGAGRVVIPEGSIGDPLLGSLTATGLGLQFLTLELVHLAGVNPDRIRREEQAYREAAQVAESSFP